MSLFSKLSKSSDKGLYPWSQKKLTGSHSPLPRSWHAAACPSNDGILIYGGLHKSSAKKDLYYFDIHNLSATNIHTSGDVPSSRIASTMISLNGHIMLYGGKPISASEPYDNGFYTLNLQARQWTKVYLEGAQPVERSGHSAVGHEGIMYIFGGQKDGTYFNDMFLFNSINSAPRWEKVNFLNKGPEARAGHNAVVFEEKIYIFGGTNGNEVLNDMWAFDINTRFWTKLEMDGNVPVAREYGASNIVDDIIYLNGGKGENGLELNDLWAFKIKTKRWFKFENIGPSPSARHAFTMTAIRDRLFVMGGDNDTHKMDDSSFIYILDSAKIKHPDDLNMPTLSPLHDVHPPIPSQPSPQQPHFNQQQQYFNQPPQYQGPNSPDTIPSPASSISSQTIVRATRQVPEAALRRTRTSSPHPEPEVHPQMLVEDKIYRATPILSAPPPRPPRDGVKIGPKVSKSDELRALIKSSPARQDSPPLQHPQRLPSQPAQGSPQLQSQRQPPPQWQPQVQPQRQVQPQPQRQAQVQPQVQPQPQPQPQVQPQPQPQPQAQPQVQPQPQPQPQAQPQVQPQAQPQRAPEPRANLQRTTSVQRDITTAITASTAAIKAAATEERQTLLREIQAREAIIQDMKRREDWWRAEVSLARKDRGPREDSAELDEELLMATDSLMEDKFRLFEQLVSVKSELRRVRGSILQQAQPMSDKVSQADRMRTAALQEAAYFKSKYLALKTRRLDELEGLELERSEDLERRLAASLSDNESQAKYCQQLAKQLQHEQAARAAAEDRVRESMARAEEAQLAHQRSLDDLQAAYGRIAKAEANVRENAVKIADLTHQLSEALIHQQNPSIQDEGLVQAQMKATQLEAANLKARHDAVTLKQKLVEQQDEIAKLKVIVQEREEQLAESKLLLEDHDIELKVLRDAMDQDQRAVNSYVSTKSY